MSRSKTNNSLLFLTTLGVYLGLVLVGGAAPQVLAHSALTRNFELQDEIEISDDLDNKPDNETAALESYAEALESIFATASELANTIPVLVEKNRYVFDTYYGLGSDGRFRGTSNLGSGVHSGKYTGPIRELYSSFPHLQEPGILPLRLEFVAEPHAFEFKTSFAQSSGLEAATVAQRYAEILPSLKERRMSAARRLVYESTQISAKENQLYIVTRLARADLDPLLATDAK